MSSLQHVREEISEYSINKVVNVSEIAENL